MFAGIFFGRGDTRGVERGLCVTRLGRHALCAGDCRADGGAMAFAVGRLSDRDGLMREFEKAGVGISRDGDLCDIVLAAYRLWGEDFPGKLPGGVTAAVIDVDASRLVLSRDRMGETAVYYACRASGVVFSDEYARVLQAPFVDKRVGRTGIGELFALGPASTPGITPVDGVKALKAGCVLVADSLRQVEKRYFDIEGEPSSDGIDKAREKVRYLVEDSLRSYLEFDPAIMLSGGLDSSILAYLMAKEHRQVRAWSVEYEDNELFYKQNRFQHDPDGEYAKLACADTNAVKNTVKIAPRELADALVEAGRARGYPGMGDIDASLLLFARGMAKSEECVLSGECADEVFGGYPWFHDSAALTSDGFPWSGSMDLRLSVLSRATLEKVNIREYEAARFHEAAAVKKRLLGASERENRLRLNHIMCFEWFMPVLQLRAAAMCSARGLRVMTPFCDDRLAKYVYSLPWEVKNAGGTPKGLLKLAFCDIIPERILQRRKSPYPKTHHPLYAKAVCEKMNAILLDKTQPINRICDGDGVRRIMSGGLKADALPWFGQLMTGAQLLAYLIQVNAFLRDNELEVEL